MPYDFVLVASQKLRHQSLAVGEESIGEIEREIAATAEAQQNRELPRLNDTAISRAAFRVEALNAQPPRQPLRQRENDGWISPKWTRIADAPRPMSRESGNSA